SLFTLSLHDALPIYHIIAGEFEDGWNQTPSCRLGLSVLSQPLTHHAVPERLLDLDAMKLEGLPLCLFISINRTQLRPSSRTCNGERRTEDVRFVGVLDRVVRDGIRNRRALSVDVTGAAYPIDTIEIIRGVRVLKKENSEIAIGPVRHAVHDLTNRGITRVVLLHKLRQMTNLKLLHDGL